MYQMSSFTYPVKTKNNQKREKEKNYSKPCPKYIHIYLHKSILFWMQIQIDTEFCFFFISRIVNKIYIAEQNLVIIFFFCGRWKMAIKTFLELQFILCTYISSQNIMLLK